jgi:hypothetical protein
MTRRDSPCRLTNAAPGYTVNAPQPARHPQSVGWLSRAGNLGTVITVFSVIWTVAEWLTTLWVTAGVASSLTDSPSWAVVCLAFFLLEMLAMLGAYVSTGIWTWRARRNADVVAPDRANRPAKAWVWLAWIVPFANFVFPQRVVEDVWRTAVHDREAIVKWWGFSWIGLLIASAFGNALGGGITSTEINGGYAAGLWISAAGATVALPFWIRVVRIISQAQDAIAGGAAAPADLRR